MNQALPQRGGVLIRVLFLILVGFLVWKFLPPWTSTVPPNKQAPASLTLDGPTHLRAGHTHTFFISLAYPQPLHADYSYRVAVEILGGSFGEQLLHGGVEVGMRSGSRSGQASFALSCEKQGEGRFELQGGDGASASDGAWQVLARVRDQSNSAAYDGAAMTVLCGDR